MSTHSLPHAFEQLQPNPLESLLVEGDGHRSRSCVSLTGSRSVAPAPDGEHVASQPGGPPIAGQTADAREALFNDGTVGSIEQVQVSTERIVALRGIFYDLDPSLFLAGSIFPELPAEPADFYRAVVQPMLNRHPLFRHAEVRDSGRGLHAILWFQRPVRIDSDGDRERWAGVVKVVQAALPIDPDQPGITATTRALGSLNSKAGRTVSRLATGEPVEESDVLSFYDEMVKSPFRTVLQMLTGRDRIEPCPVCGTPGTRLTALDFVGRCYGSCGNVSLGRLYDLVLRPRNDKEAPANVSTKH